MRGYSLLEMVLALFLLTGLILASFSVFETGFRESLKVNHQMVSARLAERISEELHSRQSSKITSMQNVPFPPPVDAYLYSVEVGSYPGPLNLQSVQEVLITVTGPVEKREGSLLEEASVSLESLFSRAPYP